MAIDIELLKTVRYFEGLDNAELESIKPLLIQKTAQRGEIFLRQGEWSDYLYFLMSGLVKVYKTSNEGREQILHIAIAGDSLNDVSTFDGGPNAASMLAMTPILLYGINKNNLRAILRKSERVTLNVIRALANRIRRDSNLVEELSFNQVIARLAKMLLRHLGTPAEEGLHLTQQDMAGLIGSSREAVNRSLKIMEDKGAIRLRRHNVLILEQELLKEMAKEPAESQPPYLQPDAESAAKH